MSYGVNAPQGFIPRRYFNNAPWDGGGIETYNINATYATPIYTGDVVVLQTDGTIAAVGVGGIAPNVGEATNILGIFMGCQYQLPTGQGVANPLINAQYWPGTTTIQPNTLVTAYILCDPNVVYDVQTTVSGGLPSTSRGNKAGFIPGNGNPVTGISGASINAVAAPGSLYAPFTILGLTPITGNQWSVGNPGNFPYNNVEVMFNATAFKAGTFGV